MSGSDQVHVAPADPSGVSPAVSLSAAMQSLFRAYQKTSIYPPGHPAIPAALTEALTGLTAALSSRDDVTVRVSRGALIVDDEPLAESREALESLSELLRELDLVALEFHTGLTLGELDSFIHELGRARREERKGPAFVEAVALADVVKVRPLALDYEALEFSEGPRGELDGETRKEVWDNLTRILTDPESSPVGLSPDQLASEIAQEISNREGSGVGLLKKRIERLNSDTRTMGSEKRDVLRKRITDFVAALSPKLRRDLLRVDPRSPESSLELMSEMADHLSESELLAALKELDSKGARVPDSLLTLLTKLIRISRKQPSLAAGLRRKLSSWGVKNDAFTDDPSSLQSALQEIFQRRERGDYLPEPHNSLLNDLARHTVDPSEFNVEGRYRDPRDMYDVRLQVAQVAVRLVGGRGGERHRAGIFAFLAAAADSLIERGSFEVLYDAAVSARTYSLLKTESEGTRRAAQGYLAEFSDEKQVQRVLEHACGSVGFSSDALNLLSLGGTAALDRVVEFLDLGPPRTIAGVLEEFAAGREPRVVAEVVKKRLDGGWPTLRPLLRLLVALPESDAVPLLERLARHEQPRARRKALATLCDVDRRPGSPERHLRRALADESPRVIAVGLQRLLRWNDDGAIEILGSYVECGIDGAVPTPDFARRAAECLLLKGHPGLRRLCGSLDKLRRSSRLRRIRLGRGVAECLAARREDPHVRRSLRRWNFSLAGAASRVLCRRSSGAGGRS